MGTPFSGQLHVWGVHPKNTPRSPKWFTLPKLTPLDWTMTPTVAHENSDPLERPKGQGDCCLCMRLGVFVFIVTFLFWF